MNSTEQKYKKLKRLLNEMESVMIAFSGGVDSTFLMKVAFDELGKRAAAITIDAPFHSRREISDAHNMASLIGARHIVHDMHGVDLTPLEFNPTDRCYICKKIVFNICREIATANSFSCLVDGSNVDDLLDHRPGRRALHELGVRSPLQEAELSKAEIRELSRKLGLQTWDKPALACLLTRFPHGALINTARLEMVEKGENYLRDMGFGQVRVRAQETTALIELDENEIPRLLSEEARSSLLTYFHSAGFTRIAVDLEGYRCGSMNLNPDPPPDAKALTTE